MTAGVSGCWRLGHRPALDGLRGIAVLLVVASHFTPGQFTSGGAIGVDVFFALSGFLITSLLLEEFATRGRISLRKFYARRTLRLAPALLIILAAATALELAGFPIDASPGMVTASLLYVSNWFLLATAEQNVIHWGSLGHTWSLSIEEQFYIVWPLLLIAAARWRGARGVIVVATAGAAVSLSIWLGFERGSLATDVSAWCLLAGCGLAAAMHGARIRSPSLLWSVPVLALVPLGAVDRFGSGWGHIIAPLATVAAMWVASQRGVPWLEVGWLRYVGRRSYGLYLWHFVVVSLFRYLAAPLPVKVAVGVMLSFALTELSWRFVETPALRMKARFFPATASRPHEVVPAT